MKRIISIVLGGSLLLSLSSCEWFNTSILGNPSKKEITERIAKEKARADSLARELNDCTTNLAVYQQTTTATTTETKLDSDPLHYHVVVGCFLMPENAANMMALLRNRGYQPKEFKFATGYACISAQSFSTLTEAYNAMARMLRHDDFCPDDVWVYDTNQRLHR